MLRQRFLAHYSNYREGYHLSESDDRGLRNYAEVWSRCCGCKRATAGATGVSWGAVRRAGGRDVLERLSRCQESIT